MSTVGIIYFVQAENDGPIKIGFTKADPRHRMVKIQSDCPWPIKLIGAIEGTVAQEKRIHLVLAPFRTQGEWFRPDPVVLAAVAEAVRVGTAIEPQQQNGKPKHDHPLCIYRHDRGLTLRELSEQTGIPLVTLSRIERRRSKPNFAAVKNIRRVTGITGAELRPDLVKIFAMAQ